MPRNWMVANWPATSGGRAVWLRWSLAIFMIFNRRAVNLRRAGCLGVAGCNANVAGKLCFEQMHKIEKHLNNGRTKFHISLPR